MSVKFALVAHLGRNAVAGPPIALNVNPDDLADLEREIVARSNLVNDGSAPMICGHVSDGTLPSVPDGAAMVFLGVALYPSPATPRGEFIRRA